MLIDLIFYATIIAAIIYGLRFPVECPRYESAGFWNLAAHDHGGRHVANARRKGRYPAGFV